MREYRNDEERLKDTFDISTEKSFAALTETLKDSPAKGPQQETP